MVTVLAGTYWVPFLWGLILLTSWLGWGECVRRLIGISADQIGWGLRAAWGMAAILSIGGFLVLAGCCNQNAMLALVLLGAAVWAIQVYTLLTTPRARPQTKRAFSWIWLLVIAFLAFCYATSVVTFDLNWWDDLIAYLPFAKQLLQTGALIDPFSLRRMLTFGGQQLLDGMLLAGGNFSNIDILELGLGQLLFVGMLLEFLPRGQRANNWPAALLTLLLLLVPRGNAPWLNTNAEMTAAILFMALARTLELDAGWRIPALAGIVGAAVSTLRANLLPVAVLGIALAYGVRILTARPERKRNAKHLLVAALAFAVILLPWSLELWRSSNTLFYPLWRGNEQQAYYNAALSPAQLLHRITAFFLYPPALALLVPFAIAAARRFRQTEAPLAIAALAGVIATLLGDSIVTYPHIYRYVFPTLFSIAAILLIRSIAAKRCQQLLALAAILLLAAVNVWPTAAWLFTQRTRSWWDEQMSPLVGVVNAQQSYQEAQSTAPPGAPIFTATSFPLLFDYARNPIYLADIQGAVSPPPGMPLDQGGAAVRDYLQKLGIHYIIFTLPEMDRTQYSRAYWQSVADHPAQFEPEKARSAPRNLQFMRILSELEKTGTTLYRSRALRVVKLP